MKKYRIDDVEIYTSSEFKKIDWELVGAVSMFGFVIIGTLIQYFHA